MKTPTEMAIDYLDGLSVFDSRLKAARWMLEDLDNLTPFKNTGAFDDLEREFDKAMEYLQNEIKEMENDDR